MNEYMGYITYSDTVVPPSSKPSSLTCTNSSRNPTIVAAVLPTALNRDHVNEGSEDFVNDGETLLAYVDLVGFRGEEEVALEEGDHFFGLIVDELHTALQYDASMVNISTHCEVPRIRLPLVRSAVRGGERF